MQEWGLKAKPENGMRSVGCFSSSVWIDSWGMGPRTKDDEEDYYDDGKQTLQAFTKFPSRASRTKVLGFPHPQLLTFFRMVFPFCSCDHSRALSEK